MKELITLQDINAAELYASDEEVTCVIDRVQTSARSIVLDIETSKGRKEIASVAAKIARSKIYLDGLGKDLVSDIKAQAKKIDIRRKTIRETLDDLKEEVRKPLTEFEENEKKRIAEHESNILWLENTLSGMPSYTLVSDLDGVMNSYNDIIVREWEEFEDSALSIGEKIKFAYEENKTKLEEAIRLAEENARLKREAEERENKEREERIEREATEKARLDAERKATEELEAERRRTREAEEAKLAAERAAIEAERREIDRSKEAEVQAKLAQEREEKSKEEAERKAIEAEKRHKEQMERAASEERERIAEAKRIEEEQAAAREADKAHKAKINNEAMQCLIDAGVSKTAAKQAVIAIAKGKVSHVSISY